MPKKLSNEEIVQRCKQPPILNGNILNDILDNTIYAYKQRRILRTMGVQLRKGVLFKGSPGNGKTLMCNYLKFICIQHNIPYKSNGMEFLEDPRFSINLLPCGIIFFDDIDINYLCKNGNSKKTSMILNILDGIETKTDTRICIFTTNERIDCIDTAMLRPGRIEHIIEFDNPDEDSRHKIINSWSPTILKHINIEDMVNKTEDFSGAQLDKIKNIIANNTVFNKPINIDDIIESIKSFSNNNKVIAGFNNE